MPKRDSFPTIERSVPLIDIERGGADKRTVTAYAATFDHLYRVCDHEGDYDEEIAPTAFNRELGRGIQRVSCIFNHGMTLWGTPAERYAMPLGTPIDIKPDGKGLVTVTRYANTELADEALELIDSGAIRFQSFRGPVYQSDVRRADDGRTIRRRLALGLKEYGPTPFPANDRAEMLAIRSQLLTEQVGELTSDQRQELLALLQETPTLDPSTPEPAEASQEPAPDAEDDPSTQEPVGPSVTLLSAANAQRRRR